jgi:hypothetical protein
MRATRDQHTTHRKSERQFSHPKGPFITMFYHGPRMPTLSAREVPRKRVAEAVMPGMDG